MHRGKICSSGHVLVQSLIDQVPSILPGRLDYPLRFTRLANRSCLLGGGEPISWFFPSMALIIPWVPVGSMAVLMGESIFTEACMAIMEGKCPEHQEAGCRDDITGKMIRPFLDELSDRLSRAWDIPVTCQTPRVIRVTTLKDLETVKNWTRFDYHWVLGDIFGARMIVLLSPEGERFSRKMARKMASNGKAEKKMYPENEPVPMCGKGGDEKDARLLGKVPLIMKWGGVPVIAEDLVNLHPGSELPLEPFLGTPVSLFVNKRRFAEGKVLVEKDTCRVLITALLGAADRGDTGKNE